MKNNITLTLHDITGWDDADVAALTKWLNAYANLLGDGSETKALQCAQVALAVDFDFPCGNINSWLHTVLALVFYELVTLLRRNSTVKHANLEQLEKQYLPVIQGADSRFNNIMDGIDFEQNREAIVAQAVKLLKGKI